ncbi:MAG: ABC transporter permease [Bacteroidetes bacterium]|nr:ABC transporter permease [Bacteroidota bacterium]
MQKDPAGLNLFRKPPQTISTSLSRLAWVRFCHEPLGIGSLLFIGLVCLAAILGYLITPDKTPFANQQFLELGLKKPGFKVDMLYVMNADPSTRSVWLHTMLMGEKGIASPLPVKSYRISKDTLYYRVYSETGIAIPAESKISLKKVRLLQTKTFWLGTDRFGRDYLSQLIIGARVSLSVGFISVFISLLIGITLGAIAGYFRGWADNLIMWFINVVWSIPTLLLVIAITFALGKGFWQVFIAVGLTMWVDVARMVRGQVMSLREKEFVEAGRALGFSDSRIIIRHILPNVMAAVIIISAANFASAILLEAGLSFLGLGVQPPVPSWGSMIKENYGYIILDYAYLAILPGIAIMLLVLAFMLMGNSLRDALDVKTRD